MTNVNRKLDESEKIVFDELLENGYPKESIVIEGQLDSRRFVDFIVNDIETGLPMMMIEVKLCGEKTRAQVKQLAYSSLKKIMKKFFPNKSYSCNIGQRERKTGVYRFYRSHKGK